MSGRRSSFPSCDQGRFQIRWHGPKKEANPISQSTKRATVFEVVAACNAAAKRKSRPKSSAYENEALPWFTSKLQRLPQFLHQWHHPNDLFKEKRMRWQKLSITNCSNKKGNSQKMSNRQIVNNLAAVSCHAMVGTRYSRFKAIVQPQLPSVEIGGFKNLGLDNWYHGIT